MGGTIISIHDLIQVGFNAKITVSLGHYFFELEFMNYDYGLIEVSRTLTMSELRKSISDQLFGFEPFERILANVICENENGISLHTVEISITPITKPLSDDATFVWSTEVSFKKMSKTPNPFLKNILSFTNHIRINDLKNSNPDS